MKTAESLSREGPHGRALVVFVIALWIAVLGLHFAPNLPVTLVLDPNREKCLPDFHLGVLVRHPSQTFSDGDLVTFRPTLDLVYVHEPFILKRVAGVAGQRVIVHEQSVLVDGHEVAHGLPLAGHYVRSLKALERDEVIPEGKLFVVGSAANSDDSRYWGYIDVRAIEGRAYRLF